MITQSTAKNTENPGHPSFPAQVLQVTCLRLFSETLSKMMSEGATSGAAVA
jgi:hypothetical protein